MKSTSKQRNKGSNPDVVKQRIHSKRIAYSLVLALIGATLYYLAYQYTYQAKLEQKYQQTQVQLEQKAKSLNESSSTNVQLQEQVKQLEQQKQDLQNQLQAKLDAKKQATAVASSIVVTGSRTDWLIAAGIPSSDWGYVDYIISHESGWNPNATNVSSGAHGLPQALPYSKTGCGWTDAVCQLQWADRYANGRYGSWAQAYNYWLSHRYW